MVVVSGPAPGFEHWSTAEQDHQGEKRAQSDADHKDSFGGSYDKRSTERKPSVLKSGFANYRIPFSKAMHSIDYAIILLYLLLMLYLGYRGWKMSKSSADYLVPVDG